MIDLHCHYIPNIDDGVKSLEDGISLLRGLRGLGFERVIATPHIRTAMFENRRPGIQDAFFKFKADVAEESDLPELGVAAEHFFDDVVWELILTREACYYPGGRALLIEFPPSRFPLGLARCFEEMKLRGVRPVLAHPERYAPLYKKSDALVELRRLGVLPLLDVMSLAGHYGRAPQAAAERMLEQGLYFAACSDSHRPAHVEVVGEALGRLRERVGEDEAELLTHSNPGRLLNGGTSSLHPAVGKNG